MNKKEFLDVMEKRLSMLETQEREDMLSEYAQHIELKMQSGMSEKEAIDDFGDIDSLIAEILEAYHIDPSYGGKAKKSAAEGIGKKASGVINRSKQSFSNFMEQQKEKQEQRMEQKREEDKDRPPRWKRKEGSGFEKGEGRKMVETALQKILFVLKVAFVFCVKACLVLVMLPAAVLTLFSLFGFGTLVVLLMQGYPLAGVTLVMLGCILGFGAVTLFVLTFIMSRWMKRKDV